MIPSGKELQVGTIINSVSVVFSLQPSFSLFPLCESTKIHAITNWKRKNNRLWGKLLGRYTIASIRGERFKDLDFTANSLLAVKAMITNFLDVYYKPADILQNKFSYAAPFLRTLTLKRNSANIYFG